MKQVKQHKKGNNHNNTKVTLAVLAAQVSSLNESINLLRAEVRGLREEIRAEVRGLHEEISQRMKTDEEQLRNLEKNLIAVETRLNERFGQWGIFGFVVNIIVAVVVNALINFVKGKPEL